MLMNAPPREFSNDVRSFVFAHGLELPYRRLPDMTNNGENAWGVSGSVASSQPAVEDWGYAFGETINTQNYLVCTTSFYELKYAILMKQIPFTPEFYMEGFVAIPSHSNDRIASQMSAASQNGVEVRREIFPTRTALNQSQCSLETGKFDSVGMVTPVSSNNVQILNAIAPISLGGPRVELSGNLIYSKSPNLDNGSLNPFSAATSSSFLMQRSPSINNLKSDRTSPSTTCSASFATGLGSRDPITASFTMPAVQDDSAGEKWWHDAQQNSSGLGSLTNDLSFYDSLPDQALISWPSESTTTIRWTKGVIPIDDTVSPQALTLESSSSSLSSPSLSSPAISSRQHSESRSRNIRLIEAPSRVSRDLPSLVSRTAGTRQKLPSKPISRPHVPILPKNDQESSNRDKIRPADSRARAHASHQAALAQKSEALRRIKPKAIKADVQQGIPGNSAVATTESVEAAAALHREARNEFLIGSRLMGMPYREIRRQGGFTEAESTLRGRFRTLTKEKRERVRKPEWGERDVSR
jgi:hypothetical protein